MRTRELFAGLLACALLGGAQYAAAAASAGFDTELAALREEWAAATYTPNKHARTAAFESVLGHAAAFSAANPQRVEAVAWEGIILSDYAGKVSPLSAMKYAKAARDALHRAEKMDPAALDGGIYVTLGALYSKVPGGIIGFGDDALAAEYFAKALAVDPDNIDNNYFYGDFLLSEGQPAKAAAVLEHALEAPPVEGRPIFDAGRRAEIRTLLAAARRKAG
jgi:tetratricopeptide (TPR) repeat protein